MDERIVRLLENFKRRNIEGLFAPSSSEAVEKLQEIIPQDASVGFSGSQTLVGLGVVKLLEARGNKVFNQNQPGLSRDESWRIRKDGVGADYYLASPNAIAESGELVIFSAYGNRTAGIAFADRVILVSGINKVVPSLSEAIQRAREYATPLNCKRLNWNTPCLKDGICRESLCVYPQYQRMCCQLLILEAEPILGRIKVLLVGESLGF